MTPAEVAAALEAGVPLIDTRPLGAFTAAHVAGALPLELHLADLAERAALLLPQGLEVMVHAEPEAAVPPSLGLLEDAGLRVLGLLEGGLQAWRAAGGAVEPLPLLGAPELRARLAEFQVIDVRERYEYVHGHVAGAELVPSGTAWRNGPPERAGRSVAVLCSGEGRAAFVAALLRWRGVPAALVSGGMYEWLQLAYPVVRND